MAANVTQSIFDVTGAAGAQFFAIVIGAFLASAGGFFVAWLLDRMERKREERSIALVCLDLLTSLGVITTLAKGARGRGDPYGPLTLRLVRGCKRDLDVYERNRERIADIADPNLRAEIYQCMARLLLSVEGVLGESEVIDITDNAIELAREKGDSAKIENLQQSRAERCTRRDASFDFLVDTTNKLCAPLAQKLRKVARSDAQSLADLMAANAPTVGTTPPQAES